MDMLDQYIINKFVESFIYASYLFFIFISIQTFFLWKNVDKNMKDLIITDFFIKKNYIYVLFLISIFIFFDLFETKRWFDTYFWLLGLLAPAILVSLSFEWYRKLKPCVSKLLPVELTHFSSISKNN